MLACRLAIHVIPGVLWVATGVYYADGSDVCVCLSYTCMLGVIEGPSVASTAQKSTSVRLAT